MSEITRKQAESALAKAVKAFDWTQIIPDGNNFLDRYRTLHAQLRKGDKLKINARKIDGDRHPDYLSFDIVLELKDGRRLRIDNPNAPLYDCLEHPVDYSELTSEKRKFLKGPPSSYGSFGGY